MISSSEGLYRNPIDEMPGLVQTTEMPTPLFKVIKDDGKYGSFALEPLPNGWGQTLGNSLRRTLLNALVGTAVTWIKIEGVQHEAATIPHVFEGVNELIDNIKGINLQALSGRRPGRLRLEANGKGEVRAGDFMTSSDFKVINADHYIAQLNSDEAKLSVEINIESGSGFQESIHSKTNPAGTISVDAMFAPVLRVAYEVEQRRHQNLTDLECLTMDVWTNGTVTPTDAMTEAAKLIIKQCNVILSSGDSSEEAVSRSDINPEDYSRLISQLKMSARTSNALSRAGITRVGEVIETPRENLLAIRNFGQKSFTELVAKLDELEIKHPWGEPTE